jgi:hypothetical protein
VFAEYGKLERRRDLKLIGIKSDKKGPAHKK